MLMPQRREETMRDYKTPCKTRFIKQISFDHTLSSRNTKVKQQQKMKKILKRLRKDGSRSLEVGEWTRRGKE